MMKLGVRNTGVMCLVACVGDTHSRMLGTCSRGSNSIKFREQLTHCIVTLILFGGDVSSRHRQSWSYRANHIFIVAVDRCP